MADSYQEVMYLIERMQAEVENGVFAGEPEFVDDEAEMVGDVDEA